MKKYSRYAIIKKGVRGYAERTTNPKEQRSNA
jgi:hypothetical protein